MPIKFYDGLTFTLDNASGEAKNLFGAVPAAAGVPAPSIQINIDKNTSLVSFIVANAKGDPGRDFAAEATARYIDGAMFNATTWPDPMNDIIIGHINWTDSNKRQLFLMWSRQPGGSDTPVKLGFFFFANQVRFSCCKGDMTLEGGGQDNGGGSGTGPNVK